LDPLRGALRRGAEIPVAELAAGPGAELSGPRGLAAGAQGALRGAVRGGVRLALEERDPEAAVHEVVVADVAVEAALQRRARGAEVAPHQRAADRVEHGGAEDGPVRTGGLERALKGPRRALRVPVALEDPAEEPLRARRGGGVARLLARGE